MEKILFYLFIFCLPFQTRIVIWQGGALFNEWTSAFFYFSDLLLIGLLLLWVKRIKFKKRWQFSSMVLIAFIFTALVSLAQAANLELGLYGVIKLIEFVFLFFYIKKNYNSIFNLTRMAQVFVASGIFQAALAIFQFSAQKSLGLKLLGESLLAFDISGVANFVVDGTRIIRAYGTLPHPNVLAAFLLLSIFSMYFLYLSKKDISFKKQLSYCVLYFILLLALWLTFSRTVCFVFIFISLFYFIVHYRKNKIKIISLLLMLAVSVVIFLAVAWPEVSSRLNFSLSDQALDLRLDYNNAAYRAISSKPLLGLGQGNFVEYLIESIPNKASWLYQPVHNIYLLIASETGLLGLSLFIYFLILTITNGIKKHSLCFSLILISFLAIGFFDHFFWTLQQGQLMFWLLLAILGSGDN